MKQVHEDDICVVTRSEVDVNRYYGRGRNNNLPFCMLKYQDGTILIKKMVSLWKV